MSRFSWFLVRLVALVVLTALLPGLASAPAGADDGDLPRIMDGYGEPIPSVPGVELGEEGAAVPSVDEGSVLTELPGPSWEEVDLSGSAVIAVSTAWVAVPGVPVEVRLAEGEALVPGIDADQVRVSSRKADEFGTGVMQVDLESVTTGGTAGAVETLALPRLEVRASLDEAAGAFGGNWADQVRVEALVVPESCSFVEGEEVPACVDQVPVEATPEESGVATFEIPELTDAGEPVAQTAPSGPAETDKEHEVEKASAFDRVSAPTATASPTNEPSNEPASAPTPGGPAPSPSTSATATAAPTEVTTAEATTESPTTSPTEAPLSSTTAVPTDEPTTTATPSTPGPAEPVGSSSMSLLIAGEGESYKSTPTKASASWQVGDGTGEFSYGYDFDLPDPLQAGAPGLSLSYSSGSVDAMTLNENGQSSAAGIGWDFSTGYVTRSYAPCGEDGISNTDPLAAEQCWKTRDGHLYEGLRLVLNGRSSDLVPIPNTSGDQFRLRDDPGWTVTRLRGQGTAEFNQDDDQEAFRVRTPDGTTYWFGYANRSRSVWTVPVRGNNVGEPCNGGASNVCRQAWQWNLDRVVDRHNNMVVYDYETETNHYARGGGNADTAYDAAGHLAEIRYGFRAGTDGPVGSARARVLIGSQERCSPAEGDNGASWTCPTPGDNPGRYADTPLNLRCSNGEACSEVGPSYFTMERYNGVKTYVRDTDSEDDWVLVDSWGLRHLILDGGEPPNEITEPSLWLDWIEHTGGSGTDAVTLPKVRFTAVQRQNRVNPGAGALKLMKPRLARIETELGGACQMVCVRGRYYRRDHHDCCDYWDWRDELQERGCCAAG